MNIFDKYSGNFYKCIYEEGEKLSIITESLRVLNNSLLEKDKKLLSFLNIFAVVIQMYMNVFKFKHVTFSEEREWRAIFTPFRTKLLDFMNSEKQNAPLLDFRDGKSMIIPFIKIPLADSGLKESVIDIVVGPGPNQKLTANSLKVFLESNNMGEIPIIISSSPYRFW